MASEKAVKLMKAYRCAPVGECLEKARFELLEYIGNLEVIAELARHPAHCDPGILPDDIWNPMAEALAALDKGS